MKLDRQKSKTENSKDKLTEAESQNSAGGEKLRDELLSPLVKRNKEVKKRKKRETKPK